MIAGKSAKHYGINIDKEQELLMNLADMVVDVYGAESAILELKS